VFAILSYRNYKEEENVNQMSTVEAHHATMLLNIKTNPISEDYEILKSVLGEGASAVIVSCVNKQTKQKCALKKLEKSNTAYREVNLHWRASQNCPYIVQIVDVYENTVDSITYVYIVMG
jgi:serine/threonine protein kinase